MIQALRQLAEVYAVTRRYLVGVSGGLDSVVLLHCLHQLGYKRLIVAHLNHALRGRASAADAGFVTRLAKKLGYEVESRREDVGQRARAEKLSWETAARQARYAFFAEVAKRRRCKKLFLAHHADDQVETVLMNIFRGTGSAGLGGMRENAQRTIDGVHLEILRPLLGVWRQELADYAAAESLRYREDVSNQDSQFLRNRVRRDLIPTLRELFGRDVRSALIRLARQCQAESDYLDALVQEESALPVLSVRHLRPLPLALRRRLVHRWLKCREVSDIDFALVEKALTLIEEDAEVAKINLPRDRFLRRRRGVLFLE